MFSFITSLELVELRRARHNLKQMWIFIKRNLWVQYAWIEWVLPFEIINLLFGIASWAFFVKMFGQSAQPLQPYGGDALSYVILGMIFYGLLTYTSHGMYGALLHLYTGTYWSGGYRLSWMEYIRLAGISPATYILAEYTLTYLRQILIYLIYLIVGFSLFGLRFSPEANYLGSLIALILGMVASLGIGMISASMIWLIGAWHGVDPLNWVINLLTSIVSGVYFPPSLLPNWLRVASYYLPHTYSIEAAKLALLSGYSNSQLMPYFLKIGLFGAIIISIGFMLIRFSLKKGEEKGSLM